MGMYVSLVSLTEATIDKLHADPPLVWLIAAPTTPRRSPGPAAPSSDPACSRASSELGGKRRPRRPRRIWN